MHEAMSSCSEECSTASLTRGPRILIWTYSLLTWKLKPKLPIPGSTQISTTEFTGGTLLFVSNSIPLTSHASSIGSSSNICCWHHLSVHGAFMILIYYDIDIYIYWYDMNGSDFRAQVWLCKEPGSLRPSRQGLSTDPTCIVFTAGLALDTYIPYHAFIDYSTNIRI